MNKKGFTLVELLVVIVIIGVLSVIIVPSVININKGINERLYEQKKENIEAAAVLYGNNNEEIFNGAEQVPVYVYELVDSNYFTADIENNKGICTSDDKKGLVVVNDSGQTIPYVTQKGCVVNPLDKTKTLNSHYVMLTKQAAGVTAEYIDPDAGGGDGSSTALESKKLVSLVCNGFSKGTLKGQAYDGASSTPVECKCNDINAPTSFVKPDGSSINTAACIISGDNVNNYLRYGDTKPNWRVLGLYKIDGKIVAKMITNEPI